MAKKKSKKKPTMTDEIEQAAAFKEFVVSEKIDKARREAELIREFGEELYNRCRKEIGLTNVQIAAHPDAESLLQYANGIHPKSNVDARIKEGVPPEPMKFEDNMPDSFTLESVLEAKFVKSNRDNYDRGNLQAFLRRINRRYGPFEPVRIVQDRSFKVMKRELITKYVIYYK